jgi:hypothetical protein
MKCKTVGDTNDDPIYHINGLSRNLVRGIKAKDGGVACLSLHPIIYFFFFLALVFFLLFTGLSGSNDLNESSKSTNLYFAAQAKSSNLNLTA